jgi:hypothetical protein
MPKVYRANDLAPNLKLDAFQNTNYQPLWHHEERFKQFQIIFKEILRVESFLLLPVAILLDPWMLGYLPPKLQPKKTSSPIRYAQRIENAKNAHTSNQRLDLGPLVNGTNETNVGSFDLFDPTPRWSGRTL